MSKMHMQDEFSCFVYMGGEEDPFRSLSGGLEIWEEVRQTFGELEAWPPETPARVLLLYRGIRSDKLLDLEYIGSTDGSFGTFDFPLRIWESREVEGVMVSGHEEPSGAARVTKLTLNGELGQVLPFLKKLLTFVGEKVVP